MYSIKRKYVEEIKTEIVMVQIVNAFDFYLKYLTK